MENKKLNLNLTSFASDYMHSSARFYVCENHAPYTVANYGRLHNSDLTGKAKDSIGQIAIGTTGLIKNK
jgi:hypothetical protein